MRRNKMRMQPSIKIPDARYEGDYIIVDIFQGKLRIQTYCSGYGTVNYIELSDIEKITKFIEEQDESS